jgi:hypothetical protein
MLKAKPPARKLRHRDGAQQGAADGAHRCEGQRLAQRTRCYHRVTHKEPAMPATTSLKLPDALKATIAKVAAFEGKTAHALMVDTLQSAMNDAVVRQQWYADGETSYQDSLRSNAVYRSADVKAYITERVRSTPTPSKPKQPKAHALHAAKPSAVAKK